jgi:hypothetical protein
LRLIHSLADEKNLDALLQRITQQTMRISAADGAITYLFNDQDNTLEPGFMQIGADEVTQLDDIPTVSLAAYNELGSTLHTKQSSVIELSREFPLQHQ